MSLKRIAEYKVWVIAVLASAATAAGTEVARSLSTLPLWIAVLVVAAFPTAVTIATSVSFAILQRTGWGRRLLAGSVWIEGYWYISTLNAVHETRPVPDGLMYIHYIGRDSDLSVVVYRPTNVDGRLVVEASESTLATFRESDQYMVNICGQRSPDSADQALGAGTFLRDGSASYPTRYEGLLIRFTEGIYRLQHAERIAERIVSTNQRQFGAKWIAVTLEQQAKLHQPTHSHGPGR